MASAVTVFVVGMKCAILLRVSTNTKIESLPRAVSGKSVIKSKLTWIQCPEGISKG